MYQEQGKKWWRLTDNPNRLPSLLYDIELHDKINKWLYRICLFLCVLSFLILIHLFTFKQKEHLIFSDGTISGCMLTENQLTK